MPIDKIKAMPVLGKILSLGRTNNPRLQEQQQLAKLEAVLSQLRSNEITESKEEYHPLKGRRMSVSGSEYEEEPLEDHQWGLCTLSLYMTTLKVLLVVIVFCALFGTIPLYRRRQMTQQFSLKVIMLLNEDLGKMAKRAAHMECGCVITTRRRHSDRPFDAVVFNADQPYSLRDLSNLNRTQDSLAVFASRTPLSLAPADEWPLFNLTMTYRLDSQLVWSEYYFSHLNQAKRLNSFIGASEHFADDMPGYKVQLLEDEIAKKDRLALYLFYEVNEASVPESLYLVELRKYVDLDAHERCGRSEDCSHYHFMLIFDPSGCPDYVPLQMYVAMHKFIVPVLIGGGNLTNLVPPHSYISSRDFPNPKDLAAHLELLVTAPEEYKRFFWWHSLYKLRRTSQPYCELCFHLQQPPEERRIETYSSPMGFYDWWAKHQCPNRSTTFL